MTERRPLVVIAEDNVGIARVMAYRFEQEGFDTLIAYDGQAAWETFQTHRVAAIISDCEMPRMTGLELCRNVRRCDWSLPFLMVTGRQPELVGSGIIKDLNIHGIFDKPFHPSAVIAKVREAMERSSLSTLANHLR